MNKYLEKKKKQKKAECSTTALAACSSLEAIEHIGVGSFYELDHSKLPPKSPELLKSIRIVMVSKKALFKVSLRFPSMESLQDFLGENSQLLPAMDEKHCLEPEAAAQALYRRVPPEEISDRSRVWSFWAVVTRRRFESVVRKDKKPEISLGGLLRWGTRKRVRFLSPTRDSSLNPVRVGVLAGNVGMEAEEKEIEDEEEEEEKEKEAAVVVRNRRSERTKKRPVEALEKPIKAPKKPKRQEKSKSERRMVIASAARWSTRRYRMAEENMLNVLKERGATDKNPVKRTALRNEARKAIGDTGLLDHLLKHMAGRVAPGGRERFRRWHNADGAMEYWLESADLVEIRKEAGVKDPYWTPPQGWKPGDDPSQDPICATMFKEIWDEIDKLKREKGSKVFEQGLAMVPTTSNSTVISMDWDQAYGTVMQIKDKYTQLAVRKSKIEEQLQEASQTLSAMEEEIMALKSTIQAPAEAAVLPQLTDNERLANEGKATKLERQRSGFRICRPQGTFLWPNMNISVSQYQLDPSAVPNTPSITFSTKPATELDQFLTPAPYPPMPSLSSGSLVKPFAERRAINEPTLLCNVINPLSLSPRFNRVSSEIEKTTSVSQSSISLQINLNEKPGDAQHNESTAISRTLTYQRRHRLDRKEKDGMSLIGNSVSDQQYEYYQKRCQCSCSSQPLPFQLQR